MSTVFHLSQETGLKKNLEKNERELIGEFMLIFRSIVKP